MEAKKLNNTGHKVIVKKVVSASRERVFDAWTKPELMNQWYCGAKGTSIASVDLRIGGKYTNEMYIEGSGSCNATESSSDCKVHTGEYLEILRPERLVFTWNSPAVQNTVVTVELKEVGDGTEVTITHELPSAEACKGHNQGWNYALSNLAALDLQN